MAQQLETRDYISISGIFATATVALLIAYWHRKQMRQIEAYKADPKIGLVPPPNPVWLFIKRYRALIFAAVNAAFLIWDASSTAPIIASDNR